MTEVKKVLKFVFTEVRKNKPGLFFVYVVLFCTTLVDKYVTLYVPKLLIDQIVEILKDGNNTIHFKYAIVYIFIFIIVTLGINLLQGICNHQKNVYKKWFDGYFEFLLANKAMKMDYEYTENAEILNQMEMAKNGISWYSGGVTGILDSTFTILENGTVMLGVVCIIAFDCPWLLPVQILSLFVTSIYNSKNIKLKLNRFKQLSKSNRICDYLFYQLADRVYASDIRLYEGADLMTEKARKYADMRIDSWAELGKQQCCNSWVIDIGNAVRDGISYLYLGRMALKKRITVGDFSLYVSSAATFFCSISGMLSGWQEILKKCTYAHHFIKFLEYPQLKTDGMKNVGKGEHEIEFCHVSFRYPASQQWALYDVNLKISSGDHIAIVGFNGAGKTTFIKLLCRLYDVTEGKILLDGVDIREYSLKEYRKLFGAVFQDFSLFPFSVKENILVGEEEDSERFLESLKFSGLYDDVVQLEKKEDTVLFKSFESDGTEFSGGQQQKVAICRALYREAPILLLDEPTAALDPKAEYELYCDFHQIVEQKTAIYISHRLSSCRFCHKVAVFADGTIREYGTHSELMKRNGIYCEMFETQAKQYGMEV